MADHSRGGYSKKPGGGWGWEREVGEVLQPWPCRAIPLKLMTVQIVHRDLTFPILREALAFSAFWMLESGPKGTDLGPGPRVTIHTDSESLSPPHSTFPELSQEVKRGQNNTPRCGLPCSCDLLGSPGQGEVAHFGQHSHKPRS